MFFNNLLTFKTNLCCMLIYADIQIFKLKYQKLTNFLKKYTKQSVPDESIIKNNYINIIDK